MTSNRTAMLSAAAEIRFAMLRNGYLPLSCHGKRPDGEEWQKRTSTNEQEIALWDWLWPYSGNTGCLTRNTPTLDVDITDRAACNAVLDRIKERFADSGIVLCRVGNAPKFAVPFRTAVPFKKIRQEIISPDGEVMKFEFLGDGQQFIVTGRHPDTGVDYRWWPRGQDLTTVPHDALPPIDEAGARALVDDLVALLVCDRGFSRPARPRPPIGVAVRRSSTAGARAVVNSLLGLLRVVANADEGNRNSLLFWATCRIHDMSAAGDLCDGAEADALDALHQAALYAGLQSTEISRTIESGMRAR